MSLELEHLAEKLTEALDRIEQLEETRRTRGMRFDFRSPPCHPPRRSDHVFPYHVSTEKRRPATAPRCRFTHSR